MIRFSSAVRPCSQPPHAIDRYPTMIQFSKRRRAASLLSALLMSLCTGHAMGERPVMEGVSMTGVDHLADHLSVQDFWVDGRHGFQAGKGGSSVCCARIPLKWLPTASVEVRWEVANWREGTWRCFRRRVSLDRYAELGELFVHFLPDGSVRAVVSNYAPWSPVYRGPRTPIPQKAPWDRYPSPPVTEDCPDNKYSAP